MNRNNKPVEIVRSHLAGVESNCRQVHNHPDKQPDCVAGRIETAINHMLQHVNEPLRISTLSEVAGVSGSHFFWLFKSATGCSPIRFFIQLRMRRASELLRNRNLTVKETADLLGYDDPYYFSRMFKSVMGVAPRHYRNRFLNSQVDSGLTQTGPENETARYLPHPQLVSS